MTKHESPMIQRWWRDSGIPGTLAEEYPIVKRQAPIQVRRLDAIVTLDDGEPGRVTGRTQVPSLRGSDVIVVQAKACRLSEGLCGQAIGSIHLAQRQGAASVRSVLLCAEDDPILRPLVEAQGVEVVVDPTTVRSTPRVAVDRPRIERWAEARGLEATFDVPVARRSSISAHAVVAHDGEPPPKRADQMDGRHLEVLVAKKPGAREGTSFGMSPIGYALMHRELARQSGASEVSARLLSETIDPVMARIAEIHNIAVERVNPS